MDYADLLDLLRRRRSPYAFDGAPVSDGAVGVPSGFEVVAAFALGRPAPDPGAVVPAALAERPAAPKPRRALADTVFGPWGEPLLPAGSPTAPPPPAPPRGSS